MTRQEKSKSGGRQSRSERDKDLPKDFSFLFYFLVWHVRTVVVTGTYVVRDTVSDEMDFRSLQERSTEAKQSMQCVSSTHDACTVVTGRFLSLIIHFLSKKNFKTVTGTSGSRTRELSHPKRESYH